MAIGELIKRRRAAAVPQLNTLNISSNISPKGIGDIIKRRRLGLTQQLPAVAEEQVYTGETDKGGILGGIGYTAGRAGLGVLGTLEGIFDFTVGGVASLIGQNEFAKSLHEADLTGDLERGLDELYRPSGGWRFAGDVASGIGQTATGVAVAAAATLATGGAAAPIADKIAIGTISLGAAGRATTEAYKTTGELGLKEYAYGALTGGIEAALESFTGATGKIAKRAISPFAKSAAKTAVRKGIVKTMLSDAAGEFVEEALSEIINPYIKRGTGVDPEAKDATMDEVIYAGLVGFVAGGISSGGASAITNASNLRRGNKIQAEGKADTVLERAKTLAGMVEGAQNIENVAEPIRGLVGSLTAYETMANKNSVRGKMLLGEIQKNVAFIEMSNGVRASEQAVFDNAEQVAAILQQNGQNITAEQIRSDKGLLTSLAIADFAGQLMSAPDIKTVLTQKPAMTESDYQNWIESLTPEAKKEVNQALGIDLDSTGYYDAMKAIEAYKPTRATKKGKALEALPTQVTLADGEEKIYRANNGNIIAIKRIGENYTVSADGADGKGIGKTSKPISQSQLNDVIAALSQADFTRPVPKKAVKKTEAKETTPAPKPKAPARQSVADATETARKYVKNFDLLSRDRRGKILEAIISGEQHNVDAKTLNAVANLIAIRNINISFAKIKNTKDGTVVPGVYTTINGNRVAVINPETNVVRNAILHEIAHDLEKMKGYEALRKAANLLADKDAKEDLIKQYKKVHEAEGKEISDAELADEVAAHYLAEVLDNSNFLENYVNEQRGFFTRVKRWLANIRSRVTGELSAQTRAIEKIYDTLLKIPKEVGEALATEAGEKSEKSTPETKKEKYSLDRSDKKDKLLADEHRKKAIDEFGYTPYFYDAGYILPDGKMLNLSGEKGKHFGIRGEDHRAIQSVFAEGELKGEYQSEGMIQFMREGNIRIVAETPGVEISLDAEPTAQQYATIKKIVDSHAPKDNYFSVDFMGSGKYGNTVDNITYEGQISSAKVINDIKYYFKNNEVPPQSDVNKFRYYLSPTADRILTEKPETYQRTFKQKVADFFGNLFMGFRLGFVDEYAGIESAGKKMGIKDIDVITQMVRSANSQAQTMLGNEQWDIITGEYQGKGLSRIIEPILKKGKNYTHSFFDYLVYKHNISRIKQGKPIFTDVSLRQTKEVVKQHEQANPEFIEYAKEIRAFLDNINKLRLDSGLISQDLYDRLTEMYPDYVPVYRDTEGGIAAQQKRGTVQVSKTIQRAKGESDLAVEPLHENIGKQVIQTVRAAAINRMANELYKGKLKNKDFDGIRIISKEKVTAEEVADADYDTMLNKNKNQITFYHEGERVTMQVSGAIFDGFNASTPIVESTSPMASLMKGAEKINSGFKKLVTSYSPAFLIRNALRDLQDAGIYTKHGLGKLAKNYGRAISEIKNNGKYWRLYRAMGGFSSSIFNFNEGYVAQISQRGFTVAENNLLKKGFNALENGNAFIEQLPRLAEFISSIEAGDSAAQALLNSADVTVNFGRSGKWGKILNRTFIPFLNPNIQGFSKLIRTVTAAKSARAFGALAIKAALLGIVPQLLNQLMYEDDEDYKNLRDTDKENNYLFKVGKNFVKLPKGRVVSVLAGLLNRSKKTLEGDMDAWEGYADNVLQQVTPVDAFARNIISPFFDVQNNITWYGTAIEGRQFENIEPKKRYDESTSSIAIRLGQFLNYSPKKIHYLLDQYTGVIGDFVLPATTKRAERGYLEGAFILDPARSNKLSEKFFKMYDEANYRKSSGDDTAIYQVRHLNKVRGAVNELFKEKSRIINSDLPESEKIKQTKVIQSLINEAYKTAINDFELLTNAIEATSGIDENLRYTETLRLVYGAERALRDYNKDTYAKAQVLATAGIGYDAFYNYYFGTKGFDKEQTLKYINKMPISDLQKLILVYASGYVVNDGDFRRYTKESAMRAIQRHINSLALSAEEKKVLAQLLGFVYVGGRLTRYKAG